MAKFTGSAALKFDGGNNRIYDIEFANGGATIGGSDALVENCDFTVALTLASGVTGTVITNNRFNTNSESCIVLSGNNDDTVIDDNIFHVTAAEI